jgi:hypothetical protein
MLPTCRPDTPMSANFSRKGMSRRHKTCQKRPRHTQFISITADKYKSAQTYEYLSYIVFVFELKQQSRNYQHVRNPPDMSSNDVSFRPSSRHVADTTHHVGKWRLGKTQHTKTFPAKVNRNSVSQRHHHQISESRVMSSWDTVPKVLECRPCSRQIVCLQLHG